MEIKDLLESEDGKAALAKAVEEETLGLKAKRDELLEANRKLRNELADRQGEMSKSAAKLALAETTVQKLLVDNGLTEALTQAKVAPEFLEAARALIKSREEIGIGESEGKPVALIGEQPLAGFVEDWARSEHGRAFIAPAGNSGGGAGGSGAGSGGLQANPWAKESRNLAEQVRLLKEDPALARRLSAEAKGR